MARAINYYCQIGNTSKGIRCGFSFLQFVMFNTYARMLRALGAGPRFYRYSHQFFGLCVTTNNIDASMVNACTLTAIFRKPIENEVFCKIPCQFSMARAFLDLHDTTLTTNPIVYRTTYLD